MKLNSCQKGQNIHPSCGKQYSVHVEIFHQGHSRIMEEDIKARENAKLPKGGVESHQLRLFGDIKLKLRVEVVL